MQLKSESESVKQIQWNGFKLGHPNIRLTNFFMDYFAIFTFF